MTSRLAIWRQRNLLPFGGNLELDMSILRSGIAGFAAGGTVDLRAFKRAVYAAARHTDATVVATMPGEIATPSFHQADVNLAADQISVVCNCWYPVIAFTTRPVQMAGIVPIDIPAFAEILRSLGFEVPAADALSRVLKPADLEILSDAEQGQAKYWKPRRVADVVFNWWD